MLHNGHRLNRRIALVFCLVIGIAKRHTGGGAVCSPETSPDIH
jgi:hypothetical protein